MDRIFIRGLQVDAVIGVFDWEQQVRQPLLFDLEMAWNIVPAASTDDLEKTLNYQAVSDYVCQHVAASRVRLLETLVEQLASGLRREFDICWLSIRVEKPAVVPQARAVGIYIERGRIGPEQPAGNERGDD